MAFATYFHQNLLLEDTTMTTLHMSPPALLSHSSRTPSLSPEPGPPAPADVSAAPRSPPPGRSRRGRPCSPGSGCPWRAFCWSRITNSQ